MAAAADDDDDDGERGSIEGGRTLRCVLRFDFVGFVGAQVWDS